MRLIGFEVSIHEVENGFQLQVTEDIGRSVKTWIIPEQEKVRELTLDVLGKEYLNDSMFKTIPVPQPQPSTFE